MAGTQPVHVLIRFADKLFSVGDVIAQHQQVIDQQGAVWIGKLGKPLAEKHVAAINRQCAARIPTHLYLAQNTKAGYEIYCAEVVAASRDDTEIEQELLPSYYKERRILGQMEFWLKLSGIRQMDREEMRRLRVASSNARISVALAESMAGMFIVREEEG